MRKVKIFKWEKDKSKPLHNMVLDTEWDGCWGYGPTENECGPCIQCKGTGNIYVSI